MTPRWYPEPGSFFDTDDRLSPPLSRQEWMSLKLFEPADPVPVNAIPPRYVSCPRGGSGLPWRPIPPLLRRAFPLFGHCASIHSREETFEGMKSCSKVPYEDAGVTPIFCAARCRRPSSPPKEEPPPGPPPSFSFFYLPPSNIATRQAQCSTKFHPVPPISKKPKKHPFLL